VFEAHSTDYQPQEALTGLVSDGFAILKVGPGLTFALREALYGLDEIAAAIDPGWRDHSLMAAMEREMLANPGIGSRTIGVIHRTCVSSAISVTATVSVLLGGSGVTRSGRKALGPHDWDQCPGAPDQSIPPDALFTRCQRIIRSDSQEPGDRIRPRCASCLRGGLRRNDVHGDVLRFRRQSAMRRPSGGPATPAIHQTRTTQQPQEMP